MSNSMSNSEIVWMFVLFFFLFSFWYGMGGMDLLTSKNEKKKVENPKKVLLNYEGPGSVVASQFNDDWKKIVSKTPSSQRCNFSISFYGDDDSAITYFVKNKMLHWPNDGNKRCYRNDYSVKNVTINNIRDPIDLFPDWVGRVIFASNSWAPLKLSVSVEPVVEEQTQNQVVETPDDVAKIAAMIEADPLFREKFQKFGITVEVAKAQSLN